MNERERDGDGVGRAYATITANKTGNKDQEDGAAEQDNAFPLNVVQTAITKAKQTTQTAITSVSKKKKKRTGAELGLRDTHSGTSMEAAWYRGIYGTVRALFRLLQSTLLVHLLPRP